MKWTVWLNVFLACIVHKMLLFVLGFSWTEFCKHWEPTSPQTTQFARAVCRSSLIRFSMWDLCFHVPVASGKKGLTGMKWRGGLARLRVSTLLSVSWNFRWMDGMVRQVSMDRRQPNWFVKYEDILSKRFDNGRGWIQGAVAMLGLGCKLSTTHICRDQQGVPFWLLTQLNRGNGPNILWIAWVTGPNFKNVCLAKCWDPSPDAAVGSPASPLSSHCSLRSPCSLTCGDFTWKPKSGRETRSILRLARLGCQR